MMALHWYGSKLFANLLSRLWQLLFMIASLYVLCDIGVFAGIELLLHSQEHQWDWKLVAMPYASKRTHWLCGVLNNALRRDVESSLTNAWAKLSTSIQCTNVCISMHYFQFAYSIWALGVVYG